MKHEGSNVLNLILLRHEENWIPYELHIFRTSLEDLLKESPLCCEFCGLNRVHHFRGKVEKVKVLQIVHSLLPISPFYSHNSHPLRDIQEHDTILLRCIQYMVTLNRCLYKIRNLLILLSLLKVIYSH
jgi:hypothetical protein